MVLLTLVGTAGFALFERLPWLDALYLTIVTVTTVGYGDFVPITPAGRMFTAGLILTGVGATLYLVTAIAQYVLDGSLRSFLYRSSMMRNIAHHTGHVVVCGYGRFGRVVVDELVRAGRTTVVVEDNADLESQLAALGVDYIIGSATVDDVLTRAGIAQADAMVVATSDEADSVFITLSARELAPSITIHARGESDSSIRRLRRAGADYVNSPYQMGGLRTAASILRPSVVDFLDLSVPGRREEIDLEEVRVADGAVIVEQEIGAIERDHPQLRIVALKRFDQPIQLVPDSSEKIEVGDHLVVIGERHHLERLARDSMPKSA